MKFYGFSFFSYQKQLQIFNCQKLLQDEWDCQWQVHAPAWAGSHPISHSGPVYRDQGLVSQYARQQTIKKWPEMGGNALSIGTNKETRYDPEGTSRDILKYGKSLQ